MNSLYAKYFTSRHQVVETSIPSDGEILFKVSSFFLLVLLIFWLIGGFDKPKNTMYLLEMNNSYTKFQRKKKSKAGKRYKKRKPIKKSPALLTMNKSDHNCIPQNLSNMRYIYPLNQNLHPNVTQNYKDNIPSLGSATTIERNRILSKDIEATVPYRRGSESSLTSTPSFRFESDYSWDSDNDSIDTIMTSMSDKTSPFPDLGSVVTRTLSEKEMELEPDWSCTFLRYTEEGIDCLYQVYDKKMIPYSNMIDTNSLNHF